MHWRQINRLLPLLFFTFFLSAQAWADISYFPITEDRKKGNGVSAFESEWYGKSLRIMNEPNLQEAVVRPEAAVYRLTILPTWGNAITVRAEQQGNIYQLISSRLDGQAGFDPGKLAEQERVILSVADSQALDALISKLRFFQQPSGEEVLGEDGDQWILEGVQGGKYHVIRRWSASTYDPEKRKLGDFLALSRFLIDHSSLTDRPVNRLTELLPLPNEHPGVKMALRLWPKYVEMKDLEGVCGLFARDVVLSYPGVPDRNYDQVCAHFSRLLAVKGKTYLYAMPKIEEMIPAGDMVVVRANWRLTVTNNKGRELKTVTEKGVHIFQRQSDSTWVIRASLGFPLGKEY